MTKGPPITAGLMGYQSRNKSSAISESSASTSGVRLLSSSSSGATFDQNSLEPMTAAGQKPCAPLWIFGAIYFPTPTNCNLA